MIARSLVCAAAAQQFFQPVAPAWQQGLRGPAYSLAEAPVVVVRVPAAAPPSLGDGLWAPALALAGGAGAAFLAARAAAGGRARRAVMVDQGSGRAPAKYSVDALNQTPWNDPREGNPFEADGVRAGVEAYQPRGISDGTVPKKSFGTGRSIEECDEPWLTYSNPSSLPSLAELEQSFDASVGFMKAEEALTIALSKATSKDAVKKAMDAASRDGARPGCPALKAGDKLLAAFKEKSEEEALKARPKAPKAPGAGGKGWDGLGRSLAKTHDNSVA